AEDGIRDGHVLEFRRVLFRSQEHNVRQGFFEEPEYRAVRDALPAVLRPVVTFLYLPGWRLGEVLALTWRQVDFRASVVRLEPGRSEERRVGKEGGWRPCGSVV